jgi:alcohol dehydrogenase/propanol-preferring alcohol dehydrogenase
MRFWRQSPHQHATSATDIWYGAGYQRYNGNGTNRDPTRLQQRQLVKLTPAICPGYVSAVRGERAANIEARQETKHEFADGRVFRNIARVRMPVMRSFQVREFGKPLNEVRSDTPALEGSEVLVRIDACGVCHSDVHLWEGYFDLGDGAKVDATRVVSPPRTLGHEIAGTVVAAGPAADGIEIGAPRVVFPWIGCGACGLCGTGDEHLCMAPRALGVHRDGGFAESVVVPHPRYLLDFGALPPEQACTYACSGLSAFGALRKAAPPGPDDPLLILGAGGVGLSGIRLARALYGRAPIVAEIDKSKWEMARDAGAGEVIDPASEGALKTLIDGTHGGVAVAIDFVGAGATFAFGLGALRKAGKLVSVGLFGGSTTIAPAIVAMKALTIRGSYVGSRPLDAVGAVLIDLKAGRVRGRVVVQP